MRTLLAIAIFAGGLLALDAPADAARKSKRTAKSPQSSQSSQNDYRRRKTYRRADEACEARARHEDPTGRYAGFPCWAREAFGRGTQGGSRRH
jgi:hypothetical protein